MKALLSRNRPEALTDRQRAALVCLLGDENPAVFQAVEARLLACGRETIESLMPDLLRAEPLARRRGRNLLNYCRSQEADTRFLAFCLRGGEDFDLEGALLLLAQTEYPEINVEGYSAMLDSHADELRARLDAAAPAESILETMNRYLVAESGFRGNEENFYDPRNSYLNCVLDRRRGNPISLCLVYLLLARRLTIPLVGIGLPGNFICRYQSARAEIYVDPFNSGQILTKGDCIRRLNHTNHSMEDGYLVPANSRRILMRICANLHQIYNESDEKGKAARFQRYLVALAK